jgi:hypothetical protein
MPTTFSGLDHELLVGSERAVVVLEERGRQLTPAELEALPDGCGPPYRQLGAIRLYRVGDLLEWGDQEQRRPKSPTEGAVTTVHVHVYLSGPPVTRPRRGRRPVAEPAAA